MGDQQLKSAARIVGPYWLDVLFAVRCYGDGGFSLQQHDSGGLLCLQSSLALSPPRTEPPPAACSDSHDHALIHDVGVANHVPTGERLDSPFRAALLLAQSLLQSCSGSPQGYAFIPAS